MKPNPCGCQVNTITYAIRYCPLHEAAPKLKETLVEIALLIESGSEDTQTILRLANTTLEKLWK